MTNFEIAPTPREYAEQTLAQAEGVLRDAVAIAFPETPDADPITAFPKPTELRAESPDMAKLTDDRMALLLEKAAELGFGRAENVTLSEQGLYGATVILEGGQPHKMLAEARLVMEDTFARPWAIVLSASPHRMLKNANEIASAERLFGEAGRTEYDVAGDVARALPDFEEFDEPRVLAASYDIHNDFATSHDRNGQFMSIGHIGATPVVLMQVNRQELGGGKYERQPDAATIMGIIDNVTRASGNATSPVAHVTSGTYRPSRAVGVALAGLTTNRRVGIATYGNDLLNEVKGDNAPAPVGQLPGELHAMAQQVEKLKQTLATS